jgi:hypothetical protein
MKAIAVSLLFAAQSILSLTASAQLDVDDIKDFGSKHLYIDVHQMPAGKVHFQDVAAAHAKDLAVQDKYGVKFLKYWVDEKNSSIYCLASAPDSEALRKTHAEAHGLLPEKISLVTGGSESKAMNGKQFFLDVHEFGPGKVSAKDVAEAHKKDLAVQGKYGVNFLNYWVDEQAGTVMCLSQAKNAKSITMTHKAAHGLMPAHIYNVQQGE